MRYDLAFTATLALIAVLSSAVHAQTTITITNAACTNPPPPAEVASPETPSVAAGVAAARNRNFALARANFAPLAAKGDVEAQRSMGQLLMQNCTGLQDKSVAVTWLTKAADAGDTLSQVQLGRAYMLGAGTAQDDAKAFALYSKAAESGNAAGETELGYFYMSGRGVPVDKYQGLVWSVKAAEQGSAVALGNIARAYMRGDVLPQDNDKAAYFMFASQQRADIQQRVEFAPVAGNIRQMMSEDDLAKASKRVQHWSPGKGSLSDVLDDAARRRDKHG